MGNLRQFVPAAALSTALALFAATASAAAIDGHVAVSDVRVGVHPGVTRVVLDVSGPAKYDLNVSGNGQAVMVDVPAAQWKARTFSGRHLRGAIAEMRVVEDGKLAILTDGPVYVKRAFALAPNSSSGYRIVIDLADGLGSAPPAAIAAPAQPAPVQVQRVAYRPVPSSQSMANGAPRMPAPVQTPPQRTAATIPPAQPAPSAQHWGTPVPARQPVTVAQARTDDQMGHRLFGISAIYARAQTGMGFLAGTNLTGATNGAAADFNLGYVFGGALGAQMDNGFRIEGEMNYAKNNVDSLVGTAAGVAVNTGTVSGDMSSLSMMGNLAYDFDFGSPIKPFILGGAGLVRVSIGDVSVGGARIANDSDWVFGYQLGGGVRYELTDQVGLEASYRFFDTLSPEFTDTTATPFEMDYRNHQFLLGAYFKL